MGSIYELSEGKKELNKIESKNLIKNLKSRYILQKLFNNLLKKKSLEIIKYNKNIKKRIKINIKDYKEYSELYSSIEIEIIPKMNEYSQFININTEDKKYYHMYFDDNKKEIKRDYNFIERNDKVRKIKIIIIRFWIHK